MELIHKVVKRSGRELYLYYPGNEPSSAFKRCSITVLLDECTVRTVRETIEKWGLKELADKYEVILSFPVPVGGDWNYSLSEGRADDFMLYPQLQDAMTKPVDAPPELSPIGIPTAAEMRRTWHPMNDTKYLIGVGSGASMALTLAACRPDNIAAVLAVNGTLCEEALARAVDSPVPLVLVNADSNAESYFVKAANAAVVQEDDRFKRYENPANPLESVTVYKTESEVTAALVTEVWDTVFSKVRRPNTGAHGSVEPRMNLEKVGFEIFLNDTRLPDGKPHTWFVHVPSCVKQDPDKKVPIMFFYHGASDNPAEAAEMSKFHELGEQEGFITVYPWGTNSATWNHAMFPEEEDDVRFCTDLIHYMLANYPVDPERVYLSGFSNGAAMAQVEALVHPELVAAICHIDSNWPGSRIGYTEVDYNDIIPFAKAMEIKKTYDYRIPVWYTYGTREPSYPVFKGSTQQNQYDFWKQYNNIEVKPTPPQDNPDPSGCGVVGDERETLTPSKRHPDHSYDVHRFYTKDEEPKNYYNYVMMHDKGHDIAQMDPALGWQYVKQFRRNPDGSVGLVVD